MIIFGLTGGVASGKSFVARLLEDQGAVLFDADAHAHAVLDEPEVRDALIERWGESVMCEGDLDRQAIAKRVFAPGEDALKDRQFLEGLIHPRVRQRLEEDLAAAEIDGATVAVLDVPLLLEASWADICTAVLFVDTPEKVRRERAAVRGWSAEEFAQREAAQMPITRKKSLADAEIPGETESEAVKGVSEAWRKWVTTGP